MTNTIKHVGVLGMHWGQHKARSESTTSTSNTQLKSHRLRPVLVKTTQTVTAIKNPTKQEIKDFVTQRRAIRISEFKKTARAAAIVSGVILAEVGALKVLDIVMKANNGG